MTASAKSGLRLACRVPNSSSGVHELYKVKLLLLDIWEDRMKEFGEPTSRGDIMQMHARWNQLAGGVDLNV